MNFARKKGFWSIVKESVSHGLVFGIVIAVIGIVGAFTLQAPYKASADFMISSTQEGQDYYTATRSAEYMSRVLGEILYSESFISAVVETGGVDVNFLPRDKKDRLEKWSKMLEVKKNPELGFINVSLSGTSEREVSKIAQAVAVVLNEKSGALFGSGGDKVSVRLLSGPIIEGSPSASELSLIVLAGLILGFFLIFTWRLVREEFRSSFFAA
ncbi:MAG: hypothetical protein WAV46_04630 [Candidatus Moraniibacteriota bacterium]